MADSSALTDKFSLRVDNAAAKQFADQVNDTGTADSYCLLTLVTDD